MRIYWNFTVGLQMEALWFNSHSYIYIKRVNDRFQLRDGVQGRTVSGHKSLDAAKRKARTLILESKS